MKCYCGSQKTFETCCQPLLQGNTQATHPEQLMRSRYSAFCTKNTEYLVATHHPDFRGETPEVLEQGLQATFKSTYWRGLKIIKTGATTVEFVAFFVDDATGPLSQLHEHSNFCYESKSWYYTDGKQLPAIKLARNELCICGRGKKFKRCCGQ